MRNISLTRKQMNSIISYAIDDLKMSKEMIYENAAAQTIKHINMANKSTFSVVCGKGENGVIGLAMARQFLSLDKKVKVFILSDRSDLNQDHHKQLDILEKTEAKIAYVTTIGELEDFPSSVKESDLIVDAIAGYEHAGNFMGQEEYAIDNMNKARRPILSLDLPSGIDCDNGSASPVYINPHLVVTFMHMKKGLKDNSRLLGVNIFVESIGIPIEASYKIVPFSPQY